MWESVKEIFFNHPGSVVKIDRRDVSLEARSADGEEGHVVLISE